MASNWPSMTFGKMVGGDGLSTNEKQRARSVFENKYGSVQELLDIADSFNVLPNRSMQDILDDSIQHAGYDVAHTFFANCTKDALFGGRNFNTARNELAIALLAKTLTKIQSYGFNNMTKADEADSAWQKVIADEGVTMGRGLLVEDLIRNHAFQKYIDDKQQWLIQLEDILQDEVYIIGTIIKQLSQNIQLPGQMKFFMLDVLGSKNIDAIAQKWIDCSNKKVVQPIIDFVKTDNHLEFVSGWLNSDPYFNEVQAACLVQKQDRVKHYHYFPTMFTDMDVYTSYGKKVQTWVNTECKKDLCTNKSPSNSSKYCPYEDSHGCFLSGTLVLLEENKETCIEHLQENDMVVGRNGNVCIVSSEKVAMSFMNATAAFGFNNDEPFFLACHPFWTQDGWRAINPKPARKENSWLDVGQLMIGDYVQKIKTSDTEGIDYEWVRIEKINCKSFPAETKFYGVHSREGPRSYHANGYLVHQNYPEITLQSVSDGMKKLSFNEQNKVKHQLKKLEPSLIKIMGPGPAKAIASLCEKKMNNQTRKPRSDVRNFLAKDLTLPHLQLNYQVGKTNLESYSMPTKMVLIRGNLFLDGQYVVNTCFFEEDIILWSRGVSGGRWEHGCLKIVHSKIPSGKGYICLTEHQHDKRSLQSASFTASSHSNIFKHFKGPVQDSVKISNKDDAWKELGVLEMGVDDEGKIIAKIQVLPNMQKPDTLLNSVQLGTDETDQLVVKVDVDPSYLSLVRYIDFYGVFNWDYTSFSGYCTEYDMMQPDFHGKSFEWKGEIDSGNENKELLEIARKESLKSSMHSKKHAISLSSSKSSPSGQQNPPSAMAAELKRMVDDHLSLQDLFTLTPPDQQEIHDATFAKLQKTMKFDMDEDDLANILGTVRPVLNADERKVADSYKEFLGDRFANSYLMNALSQNSDLAKNFTQTQLDQLLYFWAGNDKGCLSQDKDYNMANNELARLAYVEKLPRIQKYIDDDGKKWAKDLHSFLCTPQQLTNFALLANIDQDMSKTQKQAMVLNCLSPDEDLGADFYSTVLMERLSVNNGYFDGSVDAEDVMLDIIGDIIRQFVTSVLDGSDPGQQEILQEYMTQFKEMAEEYGFEIENMAIDGVNHMIDFTTAVIKNFTHMYGPAWDRLYASASDWFTKHPSVKKAANALASAITVGFWGMTIFFTVTSFMGWDNLSPEARVSLIANTVDMVMKGFASKGPGIIKAFDEAFKNGFGSLDLINDFGALRHEDIILENYKNMIGDTASAVEGMEVTAEEAIAGAAAATEGEVDVIASRWGKMFKLVEGAAKVTGVIAAAAGCVLIGFQIYRDFVNGAPVAQKALDIVQGVSFAVVAIVEIAGMVTEAACLPVIGQIAALVGIVAAFVLLFIHKAPPEPKTPVETYISDKGGPHVDALPVPTQDWLKTYKEQHPDEPEES